MDGLISLALAKKYVQASLVGAGALKGSPCTIKSVTAITGGNRITFSWLDTSNVEHTQTLDVMNGTNTTAIDDTETSNAKTWSSGKIYNELNDKLSADQMATINGQSITEGGNIVIQGGSGGGTTVVANPVLSGNEETATSIQIGNEKYVFPQTNTNGLTSAQITLLESVLYACAFTDANGRDKVDALITSLRSGVTTDTPSTDEPSGDGGNTSGGTDSGSGGSNIETPEEPSNAYAYTDTITSDIESGSFNWGIGYKLNETTGAVEEDSYYAISPKFYVANGTHLTLGNALTNGNHFMILYTTANAFKEKQVLASPYNKINNNKGKDYYYRICALKSTVTSPTTFTRE